MPWALCLLQKSFLAFLVAMGIVVTLGDAYCFSKMNKPGEADKGKVLSLDCSVAAWFYVVLPGRAQKTREGGDIRNT